MASNENELNIPSESVKTNPGVITAFEQESTPVTKSILLTNIDPDVTINPIPATLFEHKLVETIVKSEPVLITSNWKPSDSILAINRIITLASNHYLVAMLITFLAMTTSLITRIVANIVIMLLGWTMDDNSQIYLTNNVTNVIMCPSGKWNTAIIMLYRLALGVTNPYFSSNAPNENTLLGRVIAYLFNYRNITSINPSDTCYYLEINSDVHTIRPNINFLGWIIMNYNKHTVIITNNSIPDDRLKMGVSLDAPGILTSMFNWKTLLFGAIVVYSTLYSVGLFWTFPTATVVWAIWRNSILMVNQASIVQIDNSIRPTIVRQPSNPVISDNVVIITPPTSVNEIAQIASTENIILTPDTENAKHLD